MRAVAANVGLELSGLEHRIKSPASIARKLANRWESMPTATADEVAGRLDDVLRYTCVVGDFDGFYEAVDRTCRQLSRCGYVIEEVTDSFGQDTRYKGVHVIASRSDDGMRVEVQFHTTDSLDAKERTHPHYQVLRDSDRDIEERRAAGQAIVEFTRTVEDPPRRPATLGGVQVEVKTFPLPADLRGSKMK